MRANHHVDSWSKIAPLVQRFGEYVKLPAPASEAVSSHRHVVTVASTPRPSLDLRIVGVGQSKPDATDTSTIKLRTISCQVALLWSGHKQVYVLKEAVVGEAIVRGECEETGERGVHSQRVDLISERSRWPREVARLANASALVRCSRTAFAYNHNRNYYVSYGGGSVVENVAYGSEGINFDFDKGQTEE
ncbi:hypothetical protein EVAR_101954_1 [Eumeta japonica]|uniref:Uncharacterized protein n=1 Tax=Eumeta variegata TaxID=151549 RepID=A0A4C1TSE2_EUMVA|nr:hypothetical protein EVAR_101954_1 [Eumeta japonica]